MDSQVCSIGSCNMDIRSYSLNHELNSVIYDRGKAEELAAQFHQDLEEYTEFKLDEYNSRGVGSRFIDSVYRLGASVM